VHRWSDVPVEPYGLDLSPQLVALARRRLPHWADRIWQGNALYWTPPRRFDYVRTGLDYVPRNRRADYIEHLLNHVVTRRLIIGVDNTAAGEPWPDAPIAGRVEWPKPDDPRVVRRAYWIDR